jgi:hypothetical protein
MGGRAEQVFDALATRVEHGVKTAGYKGVSTLRRRDEPQMPTKSTLEEFINNPDSMNKEGIQKYIYPELASHMMAARTNGGVESETWKGIVQSLSSTPGGLAKVAMNDPKTASDAYRYMSPEKQAATKAEGQKLITALNKVISASDNKKDGSFRQSLLESISFIRKAFDIGSSK